MTQEEAATNGEVSSKPSMVEVVYPLPSRDHPITHEPVDAPLCKNCLQMELVFFDPNCPSCHENLLHPETSIPQILAVMRQWIPQSQQNIQLLINEVLKRGAHVNDRDGLTDMTLLHFACKAGASGIGDATISAKVVSMLLGKGADVHQCCRWTQMNALHCAAYFGVARVLKLLLKSCKSLDVNGPCAEFENGTALHMAASNLCLEATSILLEFNANPTARDDLGRTPADCIPEASTFSLVPGVADVIEDLQQLLQHAETGVMSREPALENISGRALLQSMGLKLGDQLTVGSKMGILRFCGATEFAAGIWAGIELDKPEGKNDGSVKGVMYFKCPPNHGVFAPINKICKQGSPIFTRRPSTRGSPSRTVNHPRVDLSHVTSKIETGLYVSKTRVRSPCSDNGMLDVGERVFVAGRRRGTIRFVGETQFAPGWWYGIELDTPEGKNDGSVHNVRYFTCKSNHGVFSPPSRVSKLTTTSDEYLSDIGSSLEGAGCAAYTISTSLRGTPDPETPKSSLTRHTSFRSSSRKTRNSRLRSSFRRPNANDTLKYETWLSEGMNVLIDNELGTIKYIGNVDFSEGPWIGVELRNPKGKNDGSVQGKRYFTCKPNHGLLVRPNKVSVRGINGATLLPET